MRNFFYNARVYNGKDAEQLYDSVLVRGNKIEAVDRKENLEPHLDRETQKIDLDGATLTPGLTDGHTHFLMHSLQLLSFRFGHCKSLKEAQELVSSGIKEKPRIGGWLLGGGWDHNFWPEGLPVRKDLDEVTGNVPAAFFSKDHHSLWVNTAGLEAAGITADTPTPAGGEIVRDEEGWPTGILMENAYDLVLEKVPPPTLEVAIHALQKGMEDSTSRGLTGVHSFEGFRTLQGLQQLNRMEKLKMRFLLGVPSSQLDAAVGLGISSGIGNEYLRIGPVKLFLDGALGSQTAALIDPYTSRPDYRGIPTMEEEEFQKLAEKAIGNGFAVAVHAIGDKVNKLAVDVIEKNLEKTRFFGLRHRIEHAQLLRPEDIAKFGPLNIIPSMQPVHLRSDQELIDKHWGEERGKNAFACRSLIDCGAELVLGSDAPVESIDPVEGMYFAIYRRGKTMEQALTPGQTLRAYTYAPAFASGEEKIKGTIEPGKLADMTVFSNDFMQNPEGLQDMEVLGTIVGGEFVFKK